MAKGKTGPKPSYRPDFHPQDFIERSKRGETLTEIAGEWNLSRTTVYEWNKKYKTMANAIKKGQEACEAWWIKLGKAGMLNEAKLNGKPVKVNLGFYVWLTKNLFKWSDRVEEKQIQKVETKTLSHNEIKTILEKDPFLKIGKKNDAKSSK